MDTKGIGMDLSARARDHTPLPGRDLVVGLDQPSAHCPAVVATGASGPCSLRPGMVPGYGVWRTTV